MLYSQYNFVVANFDYKSIITIICYDIQHDMIKIRKIMAPTENILCKDKYSICIYIVSCFLL